AGSKVSVNDSETIRPAIDHLLWFDAKVATAVRAELSKTKNKANDGRQPTKKPNAEKSPIPSGLKHSDKTSSTRGRVPIPASRVVSCTTLDSVFCAKIP
ncbi:MAG: hypothetical protein DMG52_35380, partial [Acidobacteria bacterium]